MVIEEVLRKSREREFNKGKKFGLQKGIELGINKGRKEEKNKIILEMMVLR